MINANLIPGKLYVVKLTNGKLTQAEFVESITYNSPYGNARTRYTFRNTSTGRTIVLKSRAKIKREIDTRAADFFPSEKQK